MKREYNCSKELIKENWETNKIQLLREKKTDTDITWIDLKIPLSLCPESSVQTWTRLVFGQQKPLASPLWNITHQINQRFIPQAKMLWISIQAATDVSVLSSWDGMSRRSRKWFSGTGGISSGRTTGFSLFPPCSLSPSGRSLFSGLWALLGRHRPMISWHKNWFLFLLYKDVLMNNIYTDLGVEGSTSSFFDSLLFFLERLLFCLLCLRCLRFSSNSLPLPAENARDDSWELRDESAEWVVRFLLPLSTDIKGKKTCVSLKDVAKIST